MFRNFDKDISVPSSGEKPPLIINSKSHNCLSVSTIAGSFSASATSSACFGASRASRSFRTPPWGGFAIEPVQVQDYPHTTFFLTEKSVLNLKILWESTCFFKTWYEKDRNNNIVIRDAGIHNLERLSLTARVPIASLENQPLRMSSNLYRFPFCLFL